MVDGFLIERFPSSGIRDVDLNDRNCWRGVSHICILLVPCVPGTGMVPGMVLAALAERYTGTYTTRYQVPGTGMGRVYCFCFLL